MANFNTESTKFNIEKFDRRKNFSLWQVRMKDVLVQHELEHVLEGKKKKLNEEGEAIWRKKNSKAVSTIRLCLMNDVVYNVLEESSTDALWAKLEDLYMGRNLTNKLILKQSLYALQIKEDADIHDHIAEFNKITCDLVICGVKVEDEDQVVILLTDINKHLPGRHNDPPSKEKLRAMMQEYDINLDGLLDREEFAEFIQKITADTVAAVTLNLLIALVVAPAVALMTKRATEGVPGVGKVVQRLPNSIYASIVALGVMMAQNASEGV